jgi:oligosaccharide repeat unit polymerase
MLALVHRHPRRWVLFGVFLLYCVSFVEKAYFLKAAIPLTYLVAQQRISTWIRPRTIVLGALGVLLLVTVISGIQGRDTEKTGDDFFSASYATGNTVEFIVWRSIAIPLITAADTLRIFEEEYGGKPLLGASSSLLAGLFGRERVNIENEVFAAQWGQTETETGTSNSVYLNEAYLNFGYPGVVVFSLAIGAILRVFVRSKDEALRSLWMLFCFAVFVAPLTGTVFSNGFLLVIGVAWLLGRPPTAAPAAGAPAEPSPGPR